jgi:hypothetical protein
MKKNAFLAAVLAAALLLPAAKVLVLSVMRSQLLAKPDFLSQSVAPLQKGARLELVETRGSWYLVKTAGGARGYVHQSAVAQGKGALSGAMPYKKGASEDELALAAKGFNEGNEKKLRGSRDYDFAGVEWILQQEVANAAVADFVREGGLK